MRAKKRRPSFLNRLQFLVEEFDRIDKLSNDQAQAQAPVLSPAEEHCLTLKSFLEKGLTPFPGGIYDQPDWYVKAMRSLMAAEGRLMKSARDKR